MTRHPLEVLLVRTGTRSDAMDKWVDDLVKRFEGDPTFPFSRSLGIPVRVASISLGRFLDDALARSERVAVVPLIDDELLGSDTDSGLRDEISALADRVGGMSVRCRLFPVGQTSNWYTMFQTSLQALLRGRAIEDTKMLAVALMQECIAWLRGREVREAATAFDVFVSHAKADGEGIAKRLRNALESEWRIKGFFDARDIPAGSEWTKVLVGEAAHSAMLVVQTDIYADREWCQREIATAKGNDVPVLVVSALRAGESRSFPYLGNLPTVRVDPDAPDETAVVTGLIEECLRIEHFKAQLAAMPAIASVRFSARSPELLTLRPNDQHIVYPDPPLSRTERELLRSDIELTTWRKYRRGLSSSPSMDALDVAVSMSDPAARDLAEHALAPVHVDLFWVELMRALFAADIDVAYGGDHRANGYTERLVNLVRGYHRFGHDTSIVRNFLSFHLARDLTSAARNAIMDAMKLVAVAMPAGVNETGVNDALLPYRKARAFTAMRREMAQKTRARIICGGKTDGFKGRYAGIAEEAFIHLSEGKPVYVIGLLGGCAALVGAWAADDGAALNPLGWHGVAETEERRAIISGYAKNATDPDATFDLEGHGKQLRAWLRECTDPLSPRYNGLDAAENTRLATSTDLDESLGLLMAGLVRKFGSKTI